MNAQTATATDPEFQRLHVPRKEWGAALRALQRLLRDKDDTGEVFEIMRALNGDSTRRNYHRLLTTKQGGRLAYQRVELAEQLSDRAWLATMPPAPRLARGIVASQARSESCSASSMRW